MTVERALRILAGTFVLLTVALAVFHSQWWLLLTAFVGANLFQSGLTDWCPAKTVLEKMGLPTCPPADATRTAQNGPTPPTRDE